jgi:hypothetical protein
MPTNKNLISSQDDYFDVDLGSILCPGLNMVLMLLTLGNNDTLEFIYYLRFFVTL